VVKREGGIIKRKLEKEIAIRYRMGKKGYPRSNENDADVRRGKRRDRLSRKNARKRREKGSVFAQVGMR